MNSYPLREKLVKIFSHWYTVPMLILLGSLLGWGIHLARPPLYEAKAVFTVNINYNQPDILDKIDDDHYAEDLMIVSLMGTIQSVDVLNQVIADVVGNNINFPDLKLGKRLFVERKTSNIELIVRHEDPQVAMDVANFWAEHALDYLLDAQVHALRTYTLTHEIKSLTECLSLASNSTGTVCMNLTQPELDNLLQKAESELVNEVQASRGLAPAMLFELTQKASIPDKPAVNRFQVFILTGAFLGFLVSLLILQVVNDTDWRR